LEFVGVLAFSGLLLGLYALLLRQAAKRRAGEAERQKLVHDKALSEMKLQFFSMVSHEFRTPLSVILGSAQLLAESQYPFNEEKQRKNLDRIQNSTRSMNQLLTDMLTLMRAEAGKLELHPVAIDLEAFCMNLIEDLQVTSCPPRQIYFRSQGNCARAVLDEKLLGLILANLLSNALKYSPPDSPVEMLLAGEAGAISFQVRDQGMGIPLDNQAELFEPFYRGENVKHTSGIGLGLAVVKTCVDVQGGIISIDSDLGKGTSITVKFSQPPVMEVNLGTKTFLQSHN
jgi:signal transduction histidine kinase